MVPRWQFIGLAAGAAVVPLVMREAAAHSYPLRLVRLILGASPGGIIDSAKPQTIAGRSDSC
jgi:hypothetical protein